MLNGKQKRYLRALGNKEKAIVTIGKEGISDSLIDSLNIALDSRELVKCSILKTCELDINEIEIEISRLSKSEIVQRIGKTVLLYRPSKERKIILP